MWGNQLRSAALFGLMSLRAVMFSPGAAIVHRTTLPKYALSL